MIFTLNGSERIFYIKLLLLTFMKLQQIFNRTSMWQEFRCQWGFTWTISDNSSEDKAFLPSKILIKANITHWLCEWQRRQTPPTSPIRRRCLDALVAALHRRFLVACLLERVSSCHFWFINYCRRTKFTWRQNIFFCCEIKIQIIIQKKCVRN